MRTRVLLLLVTSVLFSGVARSADESPAESARMRQLTPMLPAQPRGIGPVISDRKAWTAVAKAPAFAHFVSEAQAMIGQPVPELTDDLYLDFSRTGNRRRCEAVLHARHARLPHFVLAECIENQGRFLKPIEEAIRELCREKSWVMPAHDHGLVNFKGSEVQIDLQSAALSWNLATAAYWLGDRLSPATRQLIRDELERRTFTPFTNAVTVDKPHLSWVNGTNNWNAVCQAGVTGAAMAQIESRSRRAFFVATAEKKIRHYLNGVTPDGYCSEGLGYWNYGFGHYVLLAETIKEATGGRVDLMEGTKVRQLALFGVHIEIFPGIYPAFADCPIGAKPDPRLMAYISRRFGLGLKEVEQQNLLLAAGPAKNLFELGIHGFENSASRRPAANATVSFRPRDWFSDAGILIGRPSPEHRGAMGVALKGGHNAEHHNHNDVGSFVVALAGGTPLVDPGSEVYTARTFSSRRYDSNVLNSFGHPVPRVAGTLQREGRSAEAKILKADFTADTDTLAMDIRSAYPVKELKKLVRTFVFSRKGRGSLTIVDEVELDAPKSFGTALITFSKWKQLSPDRLEVGEGPQTVAVHIDAGDSKFRIEPTEIHEHLHGDLVPIRLGIELVEHVRKTAIRITIAPKQ